jgi:thiol-disulfide isomerase/thioredoxin
MRKSILIPLLFFSNISYTQNTKVTGSINGSRDSAIIFSRHVGDSAVSDTVKMNNGKFTWETNIPSPERVYMIFSDRIIDFFAEPGNIQIRGHAGAVDKLTITGSKTNDEAEAFKHSIADLDSMQLILHQNWDQGSKEEQLKVEQRNQELSRKKREKANQYIALHPRSIFSVSLVADRATFGDYSDVKAAYELLDTTALPTNKVQQLAKRLDILKRSMPGATVFNFTQNNTNGIPVRFSDFRGKYVLIEFWASWCGLCRAENPNLLRAYQTYKGKNFTIIGVSLDDDGEKWEKAIIEDNMPWTQLSDLKGFQNELSAYYGIMAIPSSLLVDPDGKIIATNLRGETLNKKLDELF